MANNETMRVRPGRYAEALKLIPISANKVFVNDEEKIFWQSELLGGRAFFWQLDDEDGYAIGYFFTRIQRWSDGVNELEIGPAWGNVIRVINEAWDFLYTMAQAEHCQRVSINAMREGFARLLVKAGFDRQSTRLTLPIKKIEEF